MARDLALASSLIRRLRRLWRVVGSRLNSLWRVRKKHIVVCGYPRSGTSLLYNMLTASLRGFSFDDFEVSSVNTITKYCNHVSKSPFDIFKITDILKRNTYEKEIIVLILIRDVRDVISSIHPNVPDDYFIGYEASYSVQGHHPNYETAFDAPGVGEVFREIELVKHSGDCRVRLIKYEELITHPDQVQEALARELDLQFKRRFTEFHLYRDEHGMRFEGKWQPLAASLVRSNDEVTPAYVGRWRLAEHRERLREQFTRYPALFAILRVHGYEQDESWFQDLRDAERVKEGEG